MGMKAKNAISGADAMTGTTATKTTMGTKAAMKSEDALSRHLAAAKCDAAVMAEQPMDDENEDKRTKAAGSKARRRQRWRWNKQGRHLVTIEERAIKARGLGDDGNEAKEGNLTIGIDAGGEFICELKFGEGNGDVRQITHDEARQESEQGRRCEAGQGWVVRQRGEQQDVERRNEPGMMETCRLGERDGKGVQTNREEETADGDRTDGNAEQERRGDWSHRYGPEYCSACGQNPFECGCLNVSFYSKLGEETARKRRKGERCGEIGDGLVVSVLGLRIRRCCVLMKTVAKCWMVLDEKQVRRQWIGSGRNSLK